MRYELQEAGLQLQLPKLSVSSLTSRVSLRSEVVKGFPDYRLSVWCDRTDCMNWQASIGKEVVPLPGRMWEGRL